jgi:hypothetical protein
MGANACSSAQTFAIDWFSVDGGGGTSTGGGYTLTGTTGQPDAGKMSGGGYALEGGFWSIVSALPTESRPSVGVSLASGVVRIWWPLPATDYVLDQTSSFNGTPVAWKQVPFPYQTNATHSSVTVPAPAGSRFYQLRRPVQPSGDPRGTVFPPGPVAPRPEAPVSGPIRCARPAHSAQASRDLARDCHTAARERTRSSPPCANTLGLLPPPRLRGAAIPRPVSGIQHSGKIP